MMLPGRYVLPGDKVLRAVQFYAVELCRCCKEFLLGNVLVIFCDLREHRLFVRLDSLEWLVITEQTSLSCH